MLSAIDECLDELRKAFDDIDSWIHVPFFELLVSIPEGNENDLYDLGGKYGDAASLHSTHSQNVSNHLNDLYTSWSGDGAAQAARDSVNQYMQQISQTTQALSEMEKLVNDGASEIEATKFMAIMSLVMLLITLIQVIMTLIVSFGATAAEGAGAIAFCRQALSTALKSLLNKLRAITVKGLLKVALKRALQFAAFTALSKGGIYVIQSAEGHNPTWDWKSFAGEMLDSLATGFIGGPLTVGMHGPLAEAVAMGGGQIGDNAFKKWRSEALGDSQWAKDWGLYQDPSKINLMDGVGQSMLFGAVMAGGNLKDGLPKILGTARADLGLDNLGLDNLGLGRLGLDNPDLVRLGDDAPEPAFAEDPAPGYGDGNAEATEPQSGGALDTETAPSTAPSQAGDVEPNPAGGVSVDERPNTVNEATPETEPAGSSGSSAADEAPAAGGSTTTESLPTERQPVTADVRSGTADQNTKTATVEQRTTTTDRSTTATDERTGSTEPRTTEHEPSPNRRNDTTTDTTTRTGDTTDRGSGDRNPGDRATDDRNPGDRNSTHRGTNDRDTTNRDTEGQHTPDRSARDDRTDPTDRSPEHRSDDRTNPPAREKPRFHEWQKRIEARLSEPYDRRIAEQLGATDSKTPLRLDHDMVNRLLDHKPEDLNQFGRRLRGYIEQHFTEVHDGTRTVMNDAQITATLTDLGRLTEPEHGATAVGLRERTDEPVGDIESTATEPTATEAPREQWTAADGSTDRMAEDQASTEHVRKVFGEVLDHEFGGRDWDPTSDATVATVESMTRRVMDTSGTETASAPEARRLRKWIGDNFTDKSGRRPVVLDSDAIRARLDQLYSDRRGAITHDDAEVQPSDTTHDPSIHDPSTHDPSTLDRSIEPHDVPPIDDPPGPTHHDGSITTSDRPGRLDVSPDGSTWRGDLPAHLTEPAARDALDTHVRGLLDAAHDAHPGDRPPRIELHVDRPIDAALARHIESLRGEASLDANGDPLHATRVEVVGPREYGEPIHLHRETIDQDRRDQVPYLDADGRAAAEVHVADGRLYDANGIPLDGDYMYVSDQPGARMFALRGDDGGAIGAKHSTFLGREDIEPRHPADAGSGGVNAAGWMHVRGGRIVRIDNESGHYRPTADNVGRQLDALKHAGVDLTEVEVRVGGADRTPYSLDRGEQNFDDAMREVNRPGEIDGVRSIERSPIGLSAGFDRERQTLLTVRTTDGRTLTVDASDVHDYLTLSRPEGPDAARFIETPRTFTSADDLSHQAADLLRTRIEGVVDAPRTATDVRAAEPRPTVATIDHALADALGERPLIDGTEPGAPPNGESLSSVGRAARALTDDHIRREVDRAGLPPDRAEQVASDLIARRDAVVDRYGRGSVSDDEFTAERLRQFADDQRGMHDPARRGFYDDMRDDARRFNSNHGTGLTVHEFARELDAAADRAGTPGTFARALDDYVHSPDGAAHHEAAVRLDLSATPDGLDRFEPTDAHTARDLGADNWSRLSDRQHEAFDRYTGPRYAGVDSFLRSSEDRAAVESRTDAHVMQSAMAPLADGAHVHGALNLRDLGIDHPSQLADLIGSDVSTGSFLRGATDRYEVWSDAVSATIEAPAGTHGLWLPGGDADQGGHVLFPAGSRLHVLGVDRQGSTYSLRVRIEGFDDPPALEGRLRPDFQVDRPSGDPIGAGNEREPAGDAQAITPHATAPHGDHAPGSSDAPARTNLDVLDNGGGVSMSAGSIHRIAALMGVEMGDVRVELVTDRDTAIAWDQREVSAVTPVEYGGDVIRLGPAAFADARTLAATVAHEMTHVEQLRAGVEVTSANRGALEAEAYRSEAPALARYDEHDPRSIDGDRRAGDLDVGDRAAGDDSEQPIFDRSAPPEPLTRRIGGVDHADRADVTDRPDDGPVPTHHSTTIEGTRLTPDGRPMGAPHLTADEFLSAASDLRPDDFPPRITGVVRDGDRVRIDFDDTSQTFRVVTRADMSAPAGTSVHEGTPEDPHIIVVSDRLSADVLHRTWIHEVVETLHTQEDHVAGITDGERVVTLRSRLLRLRAAIEPEHEAHNDGAAAGHIDARLAERAYLLRRFDSADPAERALLRQDIDGIDRELAGFGHRVDGLPPVGGQRRHIAVVERPPHAPMSEPPRPEAILPNETVTYDALRAHGDAILDEQREYAENPEIAGDGKTWFTSVYGEVTRNELMAIDEGVYRYPAMKLLEVIGFHEAWKVNMDRWLDTRSPDHPAGIGVEEHWQRAFAAAEKVRWQRNPMQSLNVLMALRPSVEAHIKLDLPRSIAWAVRTFYGARGIDGTEFAGDYNSMGPVFDHANEAVRPLIVDRVGRLDPGAWGISQRIGQQFILAIPELRSHAWAKAGWADQVISEGITDPVQMHTRMSELSRQAFGFRGRNDYRVGGKNLSSFAWNGQPEPPDLGVIAALRARR